jgi:hypothetical protein
MGNIGLKDRGSSSSDLSQGKRKKPYELSLTNLEEDSCVKCNRVT